MNIPTKARNIPSRAARRNENTGRPLIYRWNLVGREGFEPSTYGLRVRTSVTRNALIHCGLAYSAGNISAGIWNGFGKFLPSMGREYSHGNPPRSKGAKP